LLLLRDKGLGGEKCVNPSLLPIIILKLHLIFDGLLGAMNMDIEAELFGLEKNILEDFKVRWHGVSSGYVTNICFIHYSFT
jgi:hypothetical protein